ncbi:MAG: hypothetical protein HAW62_02600 [Endozoicomonadaceae bacterium]|nr:hypothetical protein [Endozoicomonadaceae bacterium]
MQSAKLTSLLLQIIQKCDAHQIISLLDNKHNTTISAFEYICKIRKNDINDNLDDVAKNLDSLLEYIVNKSGTSSIDKLFQTESSHYRLMNIAFHHQKGTGIEENADISEAERMKSLKNNEKTLMDFLLTAEDIETKAFKSTGYAEVQRSYTPEGERSELQRVLMRFFIKCCQAPGFPIHSQNIPSWVKKRR